MGRKKNGLENRGEVSRVRCENMAVGVGKPADQDFVGNLLSLLVGNFYFLDFPW